MQKLKTVGILAVFAAAIYVDVFAANGVRTAVFLLIVAAVLGVMGYVGMAERACNDERNLFPQ